MGATGLVGIPATSDRKEAARELVPSDYRLIDGIDPGNLKKGRIRVIARGDRHQKHTPALGAAGEQENWGPPPWCKPRNEGLVIRFPKRQPRALPASKRPPEPLPERKMQALCL